MTTSTGQAVLRRNLLIFMTFGVILATLVLQGLRLPWLIRRLGLHRDDGETQEELGAWAPPRRHWRGWRCWPTRRGPATTRRADGGLYEFRRRRLKARGGYLDVDGAEDRSLAYQRLVRELLEAQRHQLVLLRNQGEISNEVMGRIEHDLDLEDARLEI